MKKPRHIKAKHKAKHNVNINSNNTNELDDLDDFEYRMSNNEDVNYIGDKDNGIKKIFVLDDERNIWYALDKKETKRICQCGIYLIECYNCERHVLQCYSCHHSLETNNSVKWKYNQFIEPLLVSSCDNCCA
jgi:alpha-L-arabinofuranosidase